jgi:hypothetical protein
MVRGHHPILLWGLSIAKEGSCCFQGCLSGPSIISVSSANKWCRVYSVVPLIRAEELTIAAIEENFLLDMRICECPGY